MIGDSDVDVFTAKVCRCRSMGCTYGFAREKLVAADPDVLAASPADWPGLLLMST